MTDCFEVIHWVILGDNYKGITNKIVNESIYQILKADKFKKGKISVKLGNLNYSHKSETGVKVDGILTDWNLEKYQEHLHRFYRTIIVIIQYDILECFSNLALISNSEQSSEA